MNSSNAFGFAKQSALDTRGYLARAKKRSALARKLLDLGRAHLGTDYGIKATMSASRTGDRTAMDTMKASYLGNIPIDATEMMSAGEQTRKMIDQLRHAHALSKKQGLN